MFSMITGFFSSTKNIIMAIGATLMGGYILSQKYKAYQAESKLQSLENQIAKTNVAVAKEVAKSKAQAKEVETTSTAETLRTLKDAKKKVLTEMDEVEKVIQETQKEKEEVKGRTRGKKVRIKV